MKSEIKGNVKENNSDRNETRTQINCMDQMEEINIRPEHNEETIQKKKKNEERLRNFQDNFKPSNIWVIGMPEEEEEEREIENLFENIMKENSPNMAKEIDF